jgi:dienelactone hydrolase
VVRLRWNWPAKGRDRRRRQLPRLARHRYSGRTGRHQGKILVCHGDADPLAPRAAVTTFWEEMDHAGADWHFHSYGKVKHGFTDPESDNRGNPAVLGYDAAADRASWAATTDLLGAIFA